MNWGVTSSFLQDLPPKRSCERPLSTHCSTSLPQVLQDMGLPTGVEGKDSGKGDESAEETEQKPVVVAPPPVVETVSTPTAASPPADQTPEVSAGGAGGGRMGRVAAGRRCLG